MMACNDKDIVMLPPFPIGNITFHYVPEAKVYPSSPPSQPADSFSHHFKAGIPFGVSGEKLFPAELFDVVANQSVRIKKNMDSQDTLTKGPGRRINRIAVSASEVPDNYCIKSEQVSCLMHNLFNLPGFSLCTAESKYTGFEGVIISCILNNNDKGKGGSVGLISRAQQMNGIHIGLWNQLGKRRSPFVNMNFTGSNNKPL